MSKKEEPSSLAKILRQRLDRIDGARFLYISTIDGIELLSVSMESESGQSATANQTEEAQLLTPYVAVCATSADQASKLGLGNQEYSLTWIEHAILVQIKMEAACVHLYLEENANLGLLDDQIILLKKILQPFTSSNYINATL